MAILHRADLRPTKIEMVTEWAPTQPWFPSDAAAGDLETIGAFRFDDPAGEVGIETLLVRAGEGPVLQVPLTYRNAPLVGAEASFITTMHHSVLGERWVYDGVGDPVYLGAVADAIKAGGHQAELEVQVDGKLVRREPTALVQGSGSGGVVPAVEVTDLSVGHGGAVTLVDAGDLRVEVVRVLEALPEQAADEAVTGTLTGTWSGQAEPRQLVRLR